MRVEEGERKRYGNIYIERNREIKRERWRALETDLGHIYETPPSALQETDINLTFFKIPIPCFFCVINERLWAIDIKNPTPIVIHSEIKF